MNSFLNLFINTEYSLLESSIKVSDLIKFARDNKLSSIAITDHNNMYGVAQFYKECKKANIKPIIGLHLDVEDFELILLAKNKEGYLTLVKLASMKGEGKDIQISDINSENIFVIDHPTNGYYSNYNKHLRLKNYYIGSTNNIDETNYIPLFQTKALNKNGSIALDLLNSIKNKTELELSNNSEYIFKLETDLSEKACKRTFDIASECNVTLEQQQDIIPKFDKEQDGAKLLQSLIKKGIEENKYTSKEYLNRIKTELEIIHKMKYDDYFLIVADFINWAKKQGIIVGPGRGSAAGSLITKILGITEIDPLEHGLLFERFLNPDRISLPDIDVDIEDTRRQEVIDYIFDKYGQENVAHIITFQTFGAKSSLRDAARAFNIKPIEIDRMSKKVNAFNSLEYSYKNVATFRAIIEKDEINKQIYDLARTVEGLPRNVGMHAAGIVISDEPISSSVPTLRMSDGKLITQYSMNYLEEHGLLKIDVLGLRNLTSIKSILSQIYKNHQRNLLINKINNKDEKTFKLLSTGNTTGIFQLESYGMRDTLRKVMVDSFNDIVAIISLFRPGPMENIPLYSAIKKKLAPIQSVDDSIDDILKDTYGIVIYQEQIMQIAQKYAGMSFGKADILRRAIGKKDFRLMKSLKDEFYEGSKKNNHPIMTTEKVYSTIEKFANYGFNKSHAVAYGTISYRMAFLKAHFPLEFYTAVLQGSLNSNKTFKMYCAEAERLGMKIIGPEVNHSKAEVYNDGKSKIFVPLVLIAGLGPVANNKIMEEKEINGQYDNFFDLVSRLSIAGVGESNIKSLIEAGALRTFASQNALLNSLSLAIRYSEMITSKDKDGNLVLNKGAIPLPNLFEGKTSFRQMYKMEKNKLGMNLTFTPESQLKNNNVLKEQVIGTTRDYKILVDSIKDLTTKNGQKMALIQFSDNSDSWKGVIFPYEYKKLDVTLKSGHIIKAKIESKKDEKNYVEHILKDIVVIGDIDE